MQRQHSPSHAHTLDLTQATYPMGWEGTQETEGFVFAAIFKCYINAEIMIMNTTNNEKKKKFFEVHFCTCIFYFLF